MQILKCGSQKTVLEMFDCPSSTDILPCRCRTHRQPKGRHQAATPAGTGRRENSRQWVGQRTIRPVFEAPPSAEHVRIGNKPQGQAPYVWLNRSRCTRSLGETWESKPWQDQSRLSARRSCRIDGASGDRVLQRPEKRRFQRTGEFGEQGDLIIVHPDF